MCSELAEVHRNARFRLDRHKGISLIILITIASLILTVFLSRDDSVREVYKGGERIRIQERLRYSFQRGGKDIILPPTAPPLMDGIQLLSPSGIAMLNSEIRHSGYIVFTIDVKAELKVEPTSDAREKKVMLLIPNITRTCKTFGCSVKAEHGLFDSNGVYFIEVKKFRVMQ